MDPARLRVTYSAHPDADDVTAQVFLDGEQFAKVQEGTGGVMEVLFFGPGSGEPPAIELEIALATLAGAGLRLREIVGSGP